MFRSNATIKHAIIPVMVVLVVAAAAAAYLLTLQPAVQRNTVPAIPTPENVVQPIAELPIPDTGKNQFVWSKPLVKKIDLGAGYILALSAEGGAIIPPARPDTSVKRTELGAGYVLEETAYGARIIPPADLKAQTLNAAIRKTDLGGGYWLVTGPDGGQIIKEGSR